MNDAFASIQQGLQEAIDHAQGKPVKVVVHEMRGPDIKTLRQRFNMSQTEFAAAFGISPSTLLRHWERGDRKPHGTAMVLLNVLEKEPEAVLRALAA
jgi:putative transcriptional regulator